LSRAHPFGTDDIGRDVLSRIIYGARLWVGLLAVGIGTVGMVIGHSATADDWISRPARLDAIQAIPAHARAGDRLVLKPNTTNRLAMPW
jgi:ABC-type dipeptide/oligopeptide/nickel transport system permease subunit